MKQFLEQNRDFINTVKETAVMGLHQKLVKMLPGLMGRVDKKRLAACPPDPSKLVMHCDIPYLDGGHKLHLLDVYYPEGTDKPLPIIIDIHGGGWVYGDKEINKPYCLTLARAGFTVVNISYRLIPEVRFLDALKDVFAALKWVENNIGRYYGDLNNVFITGDSAGGHLAGEVLSAVTDPEVAALYGVSSGLTFRAACLMCPAVNLEPYHRLTWIPFIRHVHRVFVGEDYKTSPYLRHLSLKNNKIEKFPPLFLITNDGDFLKKQVLDFVQECAKRGVTYKLNYQQQENCTHKLQHVSAMARPDFEESQETNHAMLDFFRTYLVT
jgi:acetyl esterase/lipase